MGTARDTFIRETIAYAFGVLYVLTVQHMQTPGQYRELKLSVLGRVAYGARHASRLALMVGDKALDAYQREIEHV